MDDTTYVTIGSGAPLPSSLTIDFGGLTMYYFGFYMGSPDTYNHITFAFSGANGTQSFTGDQLIAPGNGDQSIAEFVNFNSASGFTQITMTSDQAAFETDNYAFAVPEPASIILLGTFVLGISSLIRRRRSA